MTKVVKKYTRVERHEIIAQVERLRGEGLSLPRACARIRVPYTTYYDWQTTGKVARLAPAAAPPVDLKPHRLLVGAGL